MILTILEDWGKNRHKEADFRSRKELQNLSIFYSFFLYSYYIIFNLTFRVLYQYAKVRK